MQINVPAKTLASIRNICLLGLILCGVIFLVFLFRTRDYALTEATITNKVSEVNNGIENDTQSTLIHYYRYKYVVENTEYYGQHRTLFPFIYSPGKPIHIWYNRTSPQIVRDKFLGEVLLCASVFLIVFVVFTSLGLRSVNKK